MKILVTGGAPDWVAQELKSNGHELVTVTADAYMDEQKFIEGIQGFDIYVSGGLEKCTKAVIDSADQLKAIAFLGVDPRNYINLEAAEAKNIPVFSTPGANARAVAELTILLTLNAARKAAKMFSNLENKIWQNETGFELQGKTIGLLGSGPIAQNVAKIANGFDMEVLYWTRSGEKSSMTGRYVELDDLFQKSDIVSLHIPKVSGTVIDKSVFEKFKKDAILINTSPASLVDYPALYEALSSKKLASAAFDTFYAEGEKAFTSREAKLLGLGTDRFFLTPHAGWRTVEADDNMFRIALDCIKKVAA